MTGESIPACRNAVKFKDHASDMRMKQELPDAWVFQCKGCGLVNMVSKQGVRDKSRFDHAARRMQEEVERRRAHERRPIIFT